MTLSRAEATAVAEAFGVPETQVRRDHLISHLLSALSRHAREKVVFFGGTALSRTHLPAGRLSEDLDLLAVGSRGDVVATIERLLASGAARAVGRLTWQPRLSEVRDVDPAVLIGPDGLTVRVQLLDPKGIADWPTEQRQLEQRYSDAPPAQLIVPTLPSFTAWKTAAWADRKAPRDLYDLLGLARIGAINPAAAQLFTQYGPTGHPPASHLFDRAPDEDSWNLELSGQTHLQMTASEALIEVRDAWAATTNDTPPSR